MNLINSIMDKYENLSVRKKAATDLALMLTIAIVAGIVVNLIGMYGYWKELAILFVIVTIVTIAKTYYDIRVSQHNAIKNLNNRNI